MKSLFAIALIAILSFTPARAAEPESWPEWRAPMIEKFADDKQKILSFWKKEPVIRSMDAHVDELLDHYRVPSSAEV